MVCYDEFSPGDMLNYDNSRKTMVLAFNFEQLGTAVLEKDYSWMVPIAVRSVKIKKVLGGWSHMLRRFFRVLLLGAHGWGHGWRKSRVSRAHLRDTLSRSVLGLRLRRHSHGLRLERRQLVVCMPQVLERLQAGVRLSISARKRC